MALPVSKAGVDDTVKEALDAFNEADEGARENRQAWLDDVRFVDLLQQWPEKIQRARELDARPCLTLDKIGPTIRQVTNDARQNRPAIAVHPVDDASDPETAEVFNGLIRNIERTSDAEVAYDTALAYAAKGGFGYFRINTKYADDDTFDQDIVIERIADQLSVWGDPYSVAADSSDWNLAFVIDQMPKAVFEKRWKGAEAVDWTMGDYAKMKSNPWRDGEMIGVAEYWRREEVQRKIVLLNMEAAVEAAQLGGDDAKAAAARAFSVSGENHIVGLDVYEKNRDLFDFLGVQIQGRPRDVLSYKVTQRLMTGVEVLETVDWAGKYIPIVPVYGEEAWVDGRRFLRGIVRAAKDAQRNFNYWRSTSTELVALAPKAPFIGRVGAFETDAAKWATANTEAHAYIEYDGPEAPQRQPFASVPAGALQEAMNASDDIKSITGIYDASLGARSNETSGRAILARQREGDTSNFHYIDNLSRAIRHAGRILVDLIHKVYSAPRAVRILGPDGSVENREINKPTTVKEKGEDGQIREVSRIFKLDAGKYDVTVTAGPSYTTKRDEAASQMIELIRAYPQAAPLIGDLLAKNLDWPGADEIAERLKAMLPPQLRGEDPQAQAAQDQMRKLAEALKAASDKIKSLEEDKDLKERELDIKAFDAETKRMDVMLKDAPEALTPEGVALIAAQVVAQALQTPDIAPLNAEGEMEPPEGPEMPEPNEGGAMQPQGFPPDASPMMGEAEDDD